MQAEPFIQTIALMLIVFGILAIAIGILTHFFSSFSGDEEGSQIESKGIILIGPIPIVWGYGKKGGIVAGIIAIAIFIFLTLAF